MLERVFSFSNGSNVEAVPIIAANMDTVGTFEVYNVLSKLNYKVHREIFLSIFEINT